MAILISDSFKIRESVSDEWEDILFSINSPGVPVGGSAGQYLVKQSNTDYDTAWQTEDFGISGASVDDFVKIAAVDANGKPTAFGPGTPSGGGDVTADILGIVIDGNSTPVGAAVGQYVIVKNSAISGITNGLYMAAQAIPANTAIDSTYLTAVSNGGLNGVLSRSQWVLLWENASPTSQFVTQSIPIDYASYAFFRIEFLNASNDTPVCQSIELRWLDGFVASSVVGGKIKTRYLNLGLSTAGSINIFGALVHNTYSPSAVNDDTQIIPYRIYGRKG